MSPERLEPGDLPAGWTLAASSFNWTPEVIAAESSAAAIAAAAASVCPVLEIEAGQVWRSFPAPADVEVDALRDALAATGGRASIVGASIDDWASATRRRDDDERWAFLEPQLHAAARLGAHGVRLPIGQAGPDLWRRMLPVLGELDLVLYEEVQGQQTPAALPAAYDSVAALDDPRIRLLVDISMLMPALPESYLARLEAGGVDAALVAALRTDWRGAADAVVAALRSGSVPPAVMTLFMNLLIRFGRSSVDDIRAALRLVGGVHLKFWDLDDTGGRVSQPIRDLTPALVAAGFHGTLTSEWGGHEWLDGDPTATTAAHLTLARAALATPLP